MKKNENIFIRQIYDKKKGLIGWIKYKKFLKMIDKSTPTFGILWYIADFIKTLEKVYMYNNVPTNELFSSNTYDDYQNGFVIKKENYTIKIKLKQYKLSNETILEVTRDSNSKQTTEMRFYENEPWNNDNEDREQLLINVQNIIMDSVKELFIKYYKMK